ncbi:MAG: TldD/PmbA family protein [Firmicutes bacterium]|nr:TldD/PmbA family protein [Bacillota bacterium]
MLDKNTLSDILASALSTGAEFAEVFVENVATNTINLINGKAERILSGINFGVGIRIINADKTVYLYTNKKDRDTLCKIAKNGALALKGSTPFSLITFNESIPQKNICPVVYIPGSISKNEIVGKLKEGSCAAFDYDKSITQTSMGYLDTVQDVLIANSYGLYTKDKRVRTRVSIQAVASDENEKQTGYFGPGASKGTEFLKTLDIKSLAQEAARSAVTMLKAGDCPSGRMPVIIDNGFGGVIFHEACGHGLEASAVSKNASVFAGKIGEKIASEKVTAYDDGTIENAWGSSNIDDEGHPTERNLLIENGILKTYMTDFFNGRKIGIEATGSSRRQSYKYLPVSRMTNTYIGAGTDKREDIIASTDYGLYAKYMGGGSVNPATGDFNFAVNEAYIIRKGKICEPVRGATLIGKGADILKDIDMVSEDLKLAEGMCGASSGNIPVCVGQPMIRVKEITVGGKS